MNDQLWIRHHFYNLKNDYFQLGFIYNSDLRISTAGIIELNTILNLEKNDNIFNIIDQIIRATFSKNFQTKFWWLADFGQFYLSSINLSFNSSGVFNCLNYIACPCLTFSSKIRSFLCEFLIFPEIVFWAFSGFTQS